MLSFKQHEQITKSYRFAFSISSMQHTSIFPIKKTLLSFTIINIATMKRFCCHVGYRKFISAKKNKKKII